MVTYMVFLFFVCALSSFSINSNQTLEKEMKSQETKLESLYNTGEQLIKDANYYNSNAKGIRNQIEDFEKCWADIFRFVKERTEMVSVATLCASVKEFCNSRCGAEVLKRGSTVFPLVGFLKKGTQERGQKTTTCPSVADQLSIK